MMFKPTLSACVLVIANWVVLSDAGAVLVVTSDAIGDANRTFFNGFENATFDSINGQTHATYIEGNIVVVQVNLNIKNYLPAVTTTFMTPGFEGSRSWYANGGDYGYTSISLSTGQEIFAIGMLRGSGWVTTSPPYFESTIYFEVLNDGQVVQSGTAGRYDYRSTYIGFVGGGFDEVRIRDSLYDNVNRLGNGDPFELGGSGSGGANSNALAIDSIEVMLSVPEPATLALAGLGAIAAFTPALGGRRYRRSAANRSASPRGTKKNT